MGWPRCAGLFVVGAGLVTSLALGAEPPKSVEVTLVSRAAETSSLASVVTELLDRLRVEHQITSAPQLDARDVITPHPSGVPRVARIWVELVSKERATVYVVDERWERILIRHVPTPNGLDEIAREEIAHIVEDAVGALLAGTPIGFGREEARRALGLPARPGPPKPVQPVRVPRFSGEIGAFYELSSYSSEAVIAHGAGLWLGVFLRAGSWRIGLTASGQYRNPLEAGDGVLTVRLIQGALRGMVAAERSLAPWLTVRLAAGGGADIVDIEPLGPTAGPALDAERVVLIAAARASLGLHWWLGPRVRIVTELGADFDPSNTRYFADRAGVPDYLLSPWPVRPWTSVGVTVGF